MDPPKHTREQLSCETMNINYKDDELIIETSASFVRKKKNRVNGHHHPKQLSIITGTNYSNDMPKYSLDWTD